MKRGRKPKDLAGEKIGRLKVLREETYITRKGESIRGYLCHCDCGNEKVISRARLISGKTNSCGCLIKEFNQSKKGNDYWKYRNKKRESNIKGDKTKERLHRIWKNMKQRCTNPNFPDYKKYGARGITICVEWKDSFQAFYDWSISNGYCNDLTIDRIDNDKGYSPDNCRWADKETQDSNKRTNRYITYKGVTKTATQWAKVLGVHPESILSRMRKNLPKEDVLFGVREKSRIKNKQAIEEYLNRKE